MRPGYFFGLGRSLAALALGCLDPSASRKPLLLLLLEFGFQRLQPRDEAIEVVGVGAPITLGRLTLLPSDEPRLLESSDVLLNSGLADTNPIRELLLRRERRTLPCPPMLQQLDEDAELGGIDAKPMLSTHQN